MRICGRLVKNLTRKAVRDMLAGHRSAIPE